MKFETFCSALMPNTLYCLEKVDLAAHVLKDTLRISGYEVALDGHIQPIV